MSDAYAVRDNILTHHFSDGSGCIFFDPMDNSMVAATKPVEELLNKEKSESDEQHCHIINTLLIHKMITKL